LAVPQSTAIFFTVPQSTAIFFTAILGCRAALLRVPEEPFSAPAPARGPLRAEYVLASPQ
jgi:hypothetical protein